MILCINCDDFGLSRDIDRGFFETARKGLVLSCSVLSEHVSQESMEELRQTDGVSVGLHFSLTSSRIEGFNKTLSPFSLFKAVLTGRLRPDIIQHALNHQYKRLRQLWPGEITHIDTHQHVHSIPVIRSIMEDFASQHNIPHMRNIRETSRRHSLKKHILNLAAPPARDDIIFWGTGFMGDNFTDDNILAQLEYLLSIGVRRSVWMVHVGYKSSSRFDDKYDKEREHELGTLLALSESIKDRVRLGSMREVLVELG